MWEGWLVNAANRRKAVEYYTALWAGDVDLAMDAHLSAEYREHQYVADFTRAGMARYVRARREAYPDHKIVIHHVISDGDYVFLFVEENLGDGEDFARAELFRVADGAIVEHWGGHVHDEKNRKNPNGTFDGPQVDRGVDYAARFGDRLEAMDRRGFDGQELEVFTESRPPEYIQHSPKGGDGLHGLIEILGKAKAAGIKTSMTCFRTLKDGDFLVSHRLYDSNPTHPLMNRIYTFDMFRLDAQGRAVEHWDVMDDVPEAKMLEKM
jgi:predicted SnoaL-like aldol condensation-catalyzing enzyme